MPAGLPSVDRSPEDVSFTGRLDAKDRDLEGPWVANAIAQVVAAGILPAPTGGLPEFGSRVETICLANRQEPRYGHAVGKVGWLTWREGTWQVEVSFDRPVEMRRGGRLSSAASIPSMVHVIGSSGQPFSEMTPEQVKELHEARNQAL